MKGVEGSEPVTADALSMQREVGLQRAARLATLALLIIGAVTTIGLVAWSIYVRSTDITRTMGRASLRTGLELAARLNTEYIAALGGLALLALGLAYATHLRRPWAYVVAAIGSVATIAAVWWGRSIIVRLEDPHFVKRSPWVKAATFIATAATIYLVLLCLAAALGWWTSRHKPLTST